jgi:hypothetical protein
MKNEKQEKEKKSGEKLKRERRYDRIKKRVREEVCIWKRSVFSAEDPWDGGRKSLSTAAM